MPIDVYAWSSIERLMYGALAVMAGRPPAEEARIQAVHDQVLAAPDPAREFRRWLEQATEAGELV